MTPTRMSNGNYTRIKKVVVGLSGLAMLFTSINLSKMGVGFTGDAAWIGIIIAISLTCAEFMFDSNFDEMNWTILLLGIGAYIYSIITNINGFYSYQGISGTFWSNPDTKSILGGIFMDVYPELAIAWSLNESKVGDLLGNMIKSWKDPEKMTEQNQPTSKQNNRSEINSTQRTTQTSQQTQVGQQSRTSHQSLEQRVSIPQSQQTAQKFRDFPRVRNLSISEEEGEIRKSLKEPTYHPITMVAGQENKSSTKGSHYDA